MTVFVIAEVEVTDDKWLVEYGENVHGIVHKYGGKYLSRSANIVNIEGESLPTTSIAILQFPDAESASAFGKSEEYSKYCSARQAGSNSRFRMIDDTDVAGTIPYLSKG